MATPLLELKDVRVRYGGIEAVRGVSLTVGDGELVTLIGGNGAGKTTTLNTVSGIKLPYQGEIHFEGEPIHARDRTRPNVSAAGLDAGRTLYGSRASVRGADLRTPGGDPLAGDHDPVG
jgi:branched-chain amino acid transport system ATP-binding protein